MGTCNSTNNVNIHNTETIEERTNRINRECIDEIANKFLLLNYEIVGFNTNITLDNSKMILDQSQTSEIKQSKTISSVQLPQIFNYFELIMIFLEKGNLIVENMRNTKCNTEYMFNDKLVKYNAILQSNDQNNFSNYEKYIPVTHNNYIIQNHDYDNRKMYKDMCHLIFKYLNNNIYKNNTQNIFDAYTNECKIELLESIYNKIKYTLGSDMVEYIKNFSEYSNAEKSYEKLQKENEKLKKENEKLENEKLNNEKLLKNSTQMFKLNDIINKHKKSHNDYNKQSSKNQSKISLVCKNLEFLERCITGCKLNKFK